MSHDLSLEIGKSDLYMDHQPESGQSRFYPINSKIACLDNDEVVFFYFFQSHNPYSVVLISTSIPVMICTFYQVIVVVCSYSSCVCKHNVYKLFFMEMKKMY